jgi:hypothetical protein
MSKRVVPHSRCFVPADNRRLLSAGNGHFGDSPPADIKSRMAYIYWPALSWPRFGGFNPAQSDRVIDDGK